MAKSTITLPKPPQADAAARTEAGENQGARDPFADPSKPARGKASGDTDLEVPAGFKLVKARVVKPHVSVYLHPRIVRKFKAMAEAKGKRPHDLYLEAVALYLRQHGESFEDLNRE